MAERTPLSTLLSQVLIAFTIEFDNEAERRIAESGSRRTFLVSQVMWANIMRFVGDDGVRAGDLPDLAGFPGTPVATGWMHAALAGLQRWGYLVPDPTKRSSTNPDWIARATPGGRSAQEVWRPLAGEIDARWCERFGEHEVEPLRASLAAVVHHFDIALPHSLPVVGNDMFARVPHLEAWVPNQREVRDATHLDLSALLAQVLLVFTVELERESKLSLTMRANTLRVLDDAGVHLRDLPPRTGVSKEAISVTLGFLERGDLAEVVPDPAASRGKVARLTAKGRAAQDASRRLLDATEEQWCARFGAGAVETLRESLERLLGHPDFAAGLAPHPGGWRARKPYLTQTEAMLRDPRGALAHHPLVTHRGGWPDGS